MSATLSKDDRRPFDQLEREPVFIIGAARSGTTWVFDILKSHPLVANVFESWLFTPNNGLGSLFTPAHWPGKHSGLGRLLKREELLVHVRETAEDIMGHAIRPEHRYLVEKSPSHLFAMPFIDEIFPAARYIHVLRDGRDVSVSVRAATNSWIQAWMESFGKSIRASARAWKHAVRRARHDGERMGGRFFEIRYEEIHRDPFPAYRKIFDFCEIPYDESILQSVHDATNFEKNYKPNEKGFRRGGRIGDWRTHFSLKDAVMFNLEAGQMLIDLGYEQNRKWWPGQKGKK